MEAIFRHGGPTMVDHTPSTAIDAGDVIVVEGNVRIAHSDIPANRLGALAIAGGVYDVVKAQDDTNETGGEEISDGEDVYWDSGDSLATADPDGNAYIGVAVGTASSAAATVRVLHQTARVPVESTD